MEKIMTLQDFKGVFEFVLQRELKEEDTDLFIEMMMDSCNYFIMREQVDGFIKANPDLTTFLISIKESY